MREQIILVGGGGHCKSVIDVIECAGKFEIAGILDVKEKVGENVLGYPIIGSDEDINLLAKDINNFIVTIGQLKSSSLRRRIFSQIKALGCLLPVIISPRATLSKRSFLGEGSVIHHGVIINSEVRIGANCIINTASVIEHDSIIGDFSHISTSSTINGGCEIGDDCFVGSGAIIVNGKKVISNTIIGAGSTVIQDILIPGTYVGSPAKAISRR
jgi:sugar O-acyltransferase (sialic acid O-acetyltransferase NeuD family)